MNQADFIYNAVRKGCMDSGLPQSVAGDYAAKAMSEYKAQKYNKKPVNLIEDAIKAAKNFYKKYHRK